MQPETLTDGGLIEDERYKSRTNLPPTNEPTRPALRFPSLFSGIEAASVAWRPLGWKCVGVAEIETFPRAVLKHHYPDVPNLGDVTQITDAQIAALGPIDLVCGGSPCQDLSTAGRRALQAVADSDLTLSATAGLCRAPPCV
ncbi:MAG: DNA cytosine methyltransferase [Burkholderiaceae bacterium]